MMLQAILSVALGLGTPGEVPLAAGQVTDLAGILAPEREAGIAADLRAAREAGHGDVRVLTVTSLEGRPIEEFSLRVAEASGIGSEERDDGVLLLISLEEREMRIETGRGVEAVLTDADCFAVTRKVLRPRFRAEEYGVGVEEAVSAILTLLAGEVWAPAEVAASTSGAGWFTGARWHAPPLWSALVALGALIAACLLPRSGYPGAVRGTLFGVALLAVPVGHALRPSGAWGSVALWAFAAAGAAWFFSSGRTKPFRAPTEDVLDWMFRRAWAVPMAHLVAFPIWLVRTAGGQRDNYLYWVRVGWYRTDLHRPERGVKFGWALLFAGFLATGAACGPAGLGGLLATLAIAALAFGLARGLSAVVVGLADGTLALASGTSSSSGPTGWRRDSYDDSSGSSSSSSSGGSFDGGGASDSW